MAAAAAVQWFTQHLIERSRVPAESAPERISKMYPQNPAFDLSGHKRHFSRIFGRP